MHEPLAFYLAQPYPYVVAPDAEVGGYVIYYPDLPGCITQVDDPAEIVPMAEDVRRVWLEAAVEGDVEIPLPAPVEYSGKFVIRLPRSLHRSLVEAAALEGVSLNAYVTSLLARGDAQRRVERRLDAVERAIADQTRAQPAADAAPLARSAD